MKKFLRENSVLVMGVALPLVLVAIFGIASVLPGYLTAKPAYDVVFAEESYGSISYRVKNGAIILHAEPFDGEIPAAPRLYRYHADTDRVEELQVTLPDLAVMKRPPQNHIETSAVIQVDPKAPPSHAEAQQAVDAITGVTEPGDTRARDFPVPELASLHVDGDRYAPDGYQFRPSGYAYHSDLLLVGSQASNYGPSLQKDSRTVPLLANGSLTSRYESTNFTGWIVP